MIMFSLCVLTVANATIVLKKREWKQETGSGMWNVSGEVCPAQSQRYSHLVVL